ncbi:OPT oligopeptide transporter protein-domain-containing protein [Armillaria luteobubalina]|uniref:OPT oligopeptide transporter protein-domain-containing protein n=1 Tax=Armillaria luteobubalina TaxID=153913 RepID=A0AA39PH23_9AGAR|nr:OPT oligopeptide transporter protein-domain-containing protein [Armillaria luteobubalina]KAK0495080.1 OPT oligopeptide transporter protein-domain-containing protein [Armillaria luteobubalina]
MDFDFDAIEEEDSPYPEVRASVSNIDDPDMPALTFRMWFVGLFLCLISGALNVFFNFRSPAPTVVPLALLLLSYPLGKFLAFTLPITVYRIPLPYIPSFLIPAPPLPPHYQAPFFSRLAFALSPRRIAHTLFSPLSSSTSFEFSLNPGPWNIKEHVLVFIMANVAVSNPYALYAIVVAEVYYDLKLGYWFSLVLVLATQLTGFGLAGVCRRFLVWPASMVWPQNLVACTLLNTLHAEEDSDEVVPSITERTMGMTRFRFFMWVMIAIFFWSFVPGFLFSAVSIFSFLCWAWPNNVPVNQLFGVYSGLGMSILTFDWTQISWIGSPLMVPWWAQVHVAVGFVVFYWILTPILYYTNSWDLSYFPISANEPYDRFGNVYNVSLVLRKDDTFDSEAYYNYSPLYLPATYAMCYLIAFALSTCVITHTILYHGKSLLNGVKKMRIEKDDIHAKLMRNYPEVPDWWYIISFVVFFCLAIVAVEVWHIGVPVYALLLALLLPIIYILPSGFIYAMTGQGITLNILAQIIPGTLVPGNPLANMVFKSYSVQTLTEATSFVQDLKLGHYVKVPPRATFVVQLVGTLMAAFVQVGVKTWIFANVPDICSDHQKSNLTCPHNQVFYTASAVWGLIGPTRQFGTGSIYHPHLYAIIVGVFLPLPFWLWQRRRPNSWAKYVSTPIVLNGVSGIPPAAGINYSSWFVVGVVFQYLIRKRNFAWWSKFNYVTSAALDCGTVLGLIFIFFTLQFPNGGVTLNWWGNNVYVNTADYNRAALRTIPEGGIPWPS